MNTTPTAAALNGTDVLRHTAPPIGDDFAADQTAAYALADMPPPELTGWVDDRTVAELSAALSSIASIAGEHERRAASCRELELEIRARLAGFAPEATTRPVAGMG